MLFEENSIASIAPIDTLDGDVLRAPVFQVDRIKFSEQQARVTLRDGSFFISESDLYSVKAFYDYKLTDMEVLQRITESHDISLDKTFVILEYTTEELQAKKEEAEEERKETTAFKKNHKLHKKISNIQDKLTHLHSHGVVSSEEIKD